MHYILIYINTVKRKYRTPSAIAIVSAIQRVKECFFAIISTICVLLILNLAAST